MHKKVVVGEVVSAPLSDTNSLPEGAGDFAAFDRKGEFDAAPSPVSPSPLRELREGRDRLGEFGNITDKSDDWYTPAWIFEKLGVRFDLDVAAPVEGPRYVPADSWLHENGLETPWHGFVWMNPPFGHQSAKTRWLNKFVGHGNGIALMPDRTSAPWWQAAAPAMDALLFVTPKIKFERPDGSIGEWPGTGTTLMAKGQRGVEALKRGAENDMGFLAKGEAR